MKVSHAGQRYEFHPDALGGTPQAPMLKPGDELLLRWLEEQNIDSPLAIIHEPFGVLSTILDRRQPTLFSDNVVHHERRRVAHRDNGQSSVEADNFHPYPASTSAPELVLMHLPKYLDLFELYLHKLTQNGAENLRLAASFQTRHFTPKILEIAGRYANEVHQSRAYKKARTLVLSDWKARTEVAVLPLYDIDYRDRTYCQQYGVFSASHIDYATQFLLETWRNEDQLRLLPEPGKVLEIGVGNGVILDQLHRDFYPEAKLAGTDISHVAITSARLNTPVGTDLRWQSDLEGFRDGSFDLVVTNPPFHEGHRNTIGPTVKLFREAAKALKLGGSFVVVANRHLNYATHLEKIFGDVREVDANEKFIVYLSRAVI